MVGGSSYPSPSKSGGMENSCRVWENHCWNYLATQGSEWSEKLDCQDPQSMKIYYDSENTYSNVQ